MKGIYYFLFLMGYKTSTLDMLTQDNLLQLARDVRGWME